jgi:formate-dependent nitrite reductase membrane component NrfD
MLRIFKPRSPMNLGAWCLASFTAIGAGAVGADLLELRPAAKGLGAVNAVLGGYLGSYTGVLLAATAVPLWARSRIFLGPIFVSTATATGAAATRLVLVATRRRPVGDRTRVALNRLEVAAILAELTLSTVNERRLGRAGRVLSEGRAGRLSRAAQALVGTGVALNLLGTRRVGPLGQNIASALYLAGGLAFRFAWLEAGKASARDDEAVALMTRGRVTADERLRQRTEQRTLSDDRAPAAGGAAFPAARAWSRTVGRASLMLERLLRAA